MKTVSKLFTAAVVLFTAIACQSIDEGKVVTRQLEVSATIVGSDDTKVNYDVTNDKDHNVYSISPEWTVGDEIIGFDNLGHTFTFTVAGVSPNGKNATFTLGGYEPESGVEKLYAIYAPNYSTENFKGDGEGKYLEIDLSSQDGGLDGEAPVLMCATAEVVGNKVNFSFENKTAIIGVTSFKLDGAPNATVSSMTLNGVMTTGTFAVGESGLELTATGEASSITAKGSWSTNQSGVCESAVYFAAIPTEGATLSLDAVAEGRLYKRVISEENKDIVAGKYYHTARVLEAFPVAKVTIGVDETNYYTIDEAFDEANKSTDDATITLLEDILHNKQITLTNVNGKPIVLDLNGKTLSTETASFITTEGTLTITDSGQKGMITSKAENIISLTTSGSTITLDGCKIESTAKASTANTDAAIYIRVSALPRPQIRICNGAQVYTQNGVSTIYSYYGKITLDECEITSGTNEGGRYCVYAHTGAEITVNNNASIYSAGSSAIHSGSGNAATSIQINGGYIYGTPNALTAGNSGGYSSVFTISGGFFNSDVNTISGSIDATINNGFIGLCPETVHYTPEATGVSLDYSYQYQSAVARIDYTGYTSLADAVADAKSGSTDATITLLTDITYDADATITLNNKNTTIVTLDLYGHILTAGAEKFIKGTKFTITDSKGTGKIESAYNDIIYPNYTTSVVTLKGCKIVSTLAKGSYYYSSRAVNCTNKCSLTITDGTVIEAKQTGIYCSGADLPKVIINDAKITSTGSYCIYVGLTGEVTVNGGTFHSAGYVCGYIGTKTAKFTINHGYFSRNAGTGSLLNGASDFSFTLNGGFYSKALSFENENIIQLESPVTYGGRTYTHAHTSEINP